MDIAFYENADGDSEVLNFLYSLSDKEFDKCMQYVAILMEFGPSLPAQYAKHIEGKLWELRPELGGVEMRLLYFVWVGDVAVFVHGFKKKTQKTPAREIRKALKRMEEVLS